ncbi:MAG: hypothetical protein U0667_18895, partial [Chloroflexota bacterium]
SGSVVLEDAAYRGSRVAVGWSTPLAGAGDTIRVRTSSNGGSSFGAPTVVRTHARQASFAWCSDGTLVSAFAHHHDGSGAYLLDVWGMPGGTRSITTGATTPRWPDVVCPGPSHVAWVAWVADDVVFLARATTTDPGLPATVVVGTASAMWYGPVLTASGDGVLVAWAAPSGDIMGRHATATAGITLGSPFVIGNGSPTHSGATPEIASGGARVVAAWDRCDVRTRASQDGGATWGTDRRVTDIGCDAVDVYVAPRSVAVRGTRIAIVYAIGGLGGGEERIVQSTDALAHRTNRRLAGELDEVAIGYAEVGGATRLAVAYDSGAYIRFRRCSAAACGGL